MINGRTLLSEMKYVDGETVWNTPYAATFHIQYQPCRLKFIQKTQNVVDDNLKTSK